MTERLKALFGKEKAPLLSIFFTAGSPELSSTVPIATALSEAGVDFVEIGIPFSDPLADGPVIQQSSQTAIANGMTVELVIQQVREIRAHTSIPIFLMGYLNPVLQYGMETFLSEIADAGADGVILPDLPVIDFERKYQRIFEQYNLANVFLITPQTSEERIRYLDELSSGFLYVVSSPAITGAKMSTHKARDAYLKRVKGYGLKNPLIVGFGISDREGFLSVSQYASGAIVGSAFIRFLAEHGVDDEKIGQFVKELRG